MMMLAGIKAFEACWQSLKSSYATSLSENRLLMQSMGRLVDNYATQEEIACELPLVLRGLFVRLVDAYLNGYWLEDAESMASAGRTRAPVSLTPRNARHSQPQPLQSTAASEAATYIIRDLSATSADLSVCSVCLV